MDNQFLIPANSKKSMLILGLFTELDLAIFGTGTAISVLLIFTLSLTSLVNTIIALAPVGITAFLVMPFPNYHNIRVLIQELYAFYTERQKFIWKGWCVANGKDEK